MKFQQNRFNKKSILLVLVVMVIPILLVFLSLNCSKNSQDPEQFNLPDSKLSFSQHIQPIFLNDCAFTSGCHQSGDAANGLDLENPLLPNIPNGKGQPTVFPNDADNSPLYIVLLRPYLEIPQMPPNRRLSDEKIQAIKTWINEGAKNN